MLSDDEFERSSKRFMDLADKKKEVYGEDLEALIYERAASAGGLHAAQVT